MVDFDSPVRAAMEARDQCVSGPGVDSSTNTPCAAPRGREPSAACDRVRALSPFASRARKVHSAADGALRAGGAAGAGLERPSGAWRSSCAGWRCRRSASPRTRAGRRRARRRLRTRWAYCSVYTSTWVDADQLARLVLNAVDDQAAAGVGHRCDVLGRLVPTALAPSAISLGVAPAGTK